MIGQRLLHYEIVEKLGEGGMGVVYKARDTHLDRFVAIKVLPPEKVADAGRKARFVQEAKAASALNHPNIVTIHDIGADGGTDFIVMEYLLGKTLAQMIPMAGFQTKLALEYSAQLAAALSAAHSAGVVHRDVKPANVMVTGSGIVKMLDFGLAKLAQPAVSESGRTRTLLPRTGAGLLIGTPSYMAPEQVEGLKVDHRTDIFAFGLLLYEMLTGRRAFERRSTLDTLSAIVHEEPQPVGNWRPDIPPEIERIVYRCLRKHPDDRIQHTADLKLALEDLNRLTGAGAKACSYVSIAVLPFLNLNRDEENEFLADGITGDVINALMRAKGFRVAARSSVYQFKGAPAEVREIGQRLNVDAVLEGTLRRAGERIRVTVELIKTADGFQIWSERYDRVMRDIFEIQDEIAHAIVAKLTHQLAADEAAPAVASAAVDPEAYSLYLKGRYHWVKRTPAGYRLAMECFQEASRRDPGFALPYVGVADCLLASTAWGSANPEAVLGEVNRLQQRALELDGARAEVHASIGILHAHLCNWPASRAALERAVELNPNYAAAHFWRAIYSFAIHGEWARAAREAERTIELEPFVSLYYSGPGIVALWQGKLDLAMSASKRAAEADPAYPGGSWLLAEILCQQAKFAEAAAAFEKAVASLAPGAYVGPGLLGYLYARSGREEEARRIQNRLESLRQESYAQPTALAAVSAGLGDTDAALGWLERGYDERCGHMSWIARQAAFESLRGHPRFRAILRKMNLKDDR
jgi:TolB-like protein/lipoprotein NlpI/predicted Ser/Thr protein kinase